MFNSPSFKNENGTGTLQPYYKERWQLYLRRFYYLNININSFISTEKI